jgi:hypothetical protein
MAIPAPCARARVSHNPPAEHTQQRTASVRRMQQLSLPLTEPHQNTREWNNSSLPMRMTSGRINPSVPVESGGPSI